MKFNNGHWLDDMKYDIHKMRMAYSCEKIENGLRIVASEKQIENRGTTTGGPILICELFSCRSNCIGVRLKHFEPARNEFRFELQKEEGFVPDIRMDGNTASLTSGSTKAEVEIGGSWGIRFTYNSRLLTFSWDDGTAYIEEKPRYTALRRETEDADYPWEYRSSESSYLRERLKLGVGEHIYGFGERFTTFVKNGQTVKTWNSDGGTTSEQAYKCIPFCVSSNGYGLLADEPGKTEFEVASDFVDSVTISNPGESLCYYIIGGEDMKDVLVNYTALTGRPQMPPEWSFGLWLSTSFITSYDEKTVTSFIDGMAKRDIPLSVFHFDCFWMDAYKWCSFEWDRKCFPDPKAMLVRLKAKGLHICVWANPYVSQDTEMFREGAEKGYFIHRKNGRVFQTDFWQPGMAIVDFTNPEAKKWYQDKIRKILECGVDCIKTDFGERIPTDAVYFSGAEPNRMHNYYTLLYNRAVYEVLEEVRGKGEACLFARSATVGSQQFPVHWAGDCSAVYSSMAETLRACLSLGLSGFGFCSHDISGFESTATPDLYKRWCAFGLLSTHSRLHGSNSYRVPWLFDEEACDVLRFFVRLKEKLMPYILMQAKTACDKGIPVMRPMVLEFPKDLNCRSIDTQYMLGDSLLVAPIFNEEGSATLYVPNEGGWRDLLSGEEFEGGKWYTRQYDYFSLPLLVRDDDPELRKVRM